MSTTPKLAPRGGTIFGGALLLLLATVAGVTAVFGTWSWTAITWLVIAFGVLMVLAGLIGGIARAVAPARASTDRLTPNSTDAPLT